MRREGVKLCWSTIIQWIGWYLRIFDSYVETVYHARA